jgi:hypothetical protein
MSKIEISEHLKPLYRLCQWIETTGNRGYSNYELIQNLGEEIRPILENYKLFSVCLFLGTGTRKRDFNGFGVKRKPSWQSEYLAMYHRLVGTDEFYTDILDQQHEAALKDDVHESKRRARPHTYFTHAELDNMTAIQLFNRYGIGRMQPHFIAEKNNLRNWIESVWRKQSDALLDEFLWRVMFSTGNLKSDACQLWEKLELPSFVRENPKGSEDFIGNVIYDYIYPFRYRQMIFDGKAGYWTETDLVEFPMAYQPMQYKAMTDNQLLQLFYRMFHDKSDNTMIFITPANMKIIADKIRHEFINRKGDF